MVFVSSAFCVLIAWTAAAQITRPPQIPRPAPAASPQTPAQRPAVAREHKIPVGEMEVRAVTQTQDGPWYHLRVHTSLETSDLLLRADEMDYNRETGEAYARGNVYFKNYEGGEELWADRVDYNLHDETGKFYNVRGKSPVNLAPRPGILTSTSPFYFQGDWAERLKDRYVLYDGFVTNCRMPKPWWILKGPKFDIVPDERALAYRTMFRLKGIPLLYAPVFYKSLESRPRKSGFLTPNIGNSSRRGKMIGGGYYWAINRSYDAAYRAQYFTQRGIAHHIDLRGRPRQGTDFNFILYGVNDRGLPYEESVQLPNGTWTTVEKRRKEGGAMFSFTGQSDLGNGFYARADVNYLTSFQFRQAFTESFNEAIFSEVHSIGYVTKNWSNFGLNFVMSRNENFQSLKPDDTIVIRKYPNVEFNARDTQVVDGPVPIWVSLDSSAGLLRRKQLLFQTRQLLERADAQPRIMTALRWKDFNLIPSFSIRETHWGESMEQGKIVGRNINRNAREFSVVLEAPPIGRIFDSPHWLGDKLKHVIEPQITYEKVSGIEDFNRFIRFDETELLSNTSQAEFSITNRLYVKRKGSVDEIMTWQVMQQRYFDPTFGGAVEQGRRNVVLSAVELTPYAFLDGPRHYSPIVSVYRVSPKPGFGVEWRADYDPLRGHIVNSGLTADVRVSKYFISLGHNSVSAIPLAAPGKKPFQGNACDPQFTGTVQLLSPCANQMRGYFGWGNENRRGWNAGFSAVYDFRTAVMQFATTQVTYNTDCCGFSVQYRRFSFGTRNENQFRIAFNVANIGSFGTLKKQERLF